MTNTARSDIGAVMLQDLGRKAVARAEVHTGGALLLTSHKFNQDVNVHPLVVRAFEFDATNSDIWQRRSLSACRLETLKFESWLEDGQELYDVSTHQQRWCDLLPVENKTARGTYALLAKHLANAGVTRLWRDQAGPAVKSTQPTQMERPTISVWCCSTDRGPDCVGVRQLIEQEAGDYDLTFLNDCGKHAGHCIVRATLKLADVVLWKIGK